MPSKNVFSKAKKDQCEYTKNGCKENERKRHMKMFRKIGRKKESKDFRKLLYAHAKVERKGGSLLKEGEA